MPLSTRIGFTLIMLSAFATMVAIALGYPPAARFLPLVIGVPGIVLTLCQLFVDIRDLRRAPTARRRRLKFSGVAEAAGTSRPPGDPGIRVDGEPPVSDDGNIDSVPRREMVLFAYFFALVAGVILFGFWLAIPAFIFFYLRAHERESLRFALCLTLAGSGVLYVIFDLMLSIVLHEGFITAAARDWVAQ